MGSAKLRDESGWVSYEEATEKKTRQTKGQRGDAEGREERRALKGKIEDREGEREGV